MQPSLQEIGLAAIRDIDARRAKRRIRRKDLPAPGARRPIKTKLVPVDLPLADAFQSWEQAAIRNQPPVTVPARPKRYLVIGVMGVVMMVTCSLGLVWV